MVTARDLLTVTLRQTDSDSDLLMEIHLVKQTGLHWAMLKGLQRETLKAKHLH